MKYLLILSSILAVSSFVHLGVLPERIIDFQLQKGMDKPTHYIQELDKKKIAQGKDLILKGYTKVDGKKSKVISKHYVCTNCHNIVQEDPNLQNTTPEARLKYANEKGIPFLQGTTLYGTVNRSHWYNGDYALKYGDLVKPAKDTLVNAIQLCAQVCSQGRVLEDWEVESMLHYLWTLDLKTADVDVNAEMTLEQIQVSYEQGSPATFIYTTKEDIEKLEGNPEIGKQIYTLSCMECHYGKGRISELTIADDKFSKSRFEKNLYKGNDFDLLYITRNGTKPHLTHQPYMPHYTKERLSDQQLADLISYIKNK